MMPSDLNLRTDDITKAYPVREIVRKPSDPSSLRTDDIQPPKPRFTNREFNIVSDDSGSQPFSITTNKLYTRDVAEQKRAIQPGIGRELLSLKVSDIDGARPRKDRSTPARDTNPLDPVYKLPSFEEVPVEPVKFRRDNMDTSDIFGTRPFDPKQLMPTRPIMQVDDIGGTSAKLAHRARAGVQLDALNVRDITDVQFKSKRTANPLEPECVVSRASGLLTHHDWEYIDAQQAGSEKVVLGPVPGCHPRPPPRERPSSQQFALRTADVSGTLKKVTPWQHSSIERREWRPINATQDIAGAQAGTRAKLQTNRCTDPVNPQYSLPGGDRPVTAPYLEHEVDPASLPAAGATRKPKVKESDKEKYDIFTWKPLAQSETSFGHGVSPQFVERMTIRPKSPEASSGEASPVSPPAKAVYAEVPSLRLSEKSEVFARSAERIVTPKSSEPAPVEKLRPATQATGAAAKLSVQERLEKWLQKEGDFYHTAMQSDVFHQKQFSEEEEREFARKTTFSSFAAVNSTASRSEAAQVDPVPRALPRARLPVSKGTEMIVRAKNAHSAAGYGALERARVRQSEIDAVRGLK